MPPMRHDVPMRGPRAARIACWRPWLAMAVVSLSMAALTARAEDPAPPAAESAPESLSPIPPPPSVTAADLPDDNGHGIQVRWTPSPGDAELLAYEVWVAHASGVPDTSWAMAGTAP